jgi:hypothetical protein
MNRRPAFALIATALSVGVLSGCATAPKPAAEALASDILNGRSNQRACGPDEVRYCAASGSRLNSLNKVSECGCIPGSAFRGSIQPY